MKFKINDWVMTQQLYWAPAMYVAQINEEKETYTCRFYQNDEIHTVELFEHELVDATPQDQYAEFSVTQWVKHKFYSFLPPMYVIEVRYKQSDAYIKCRYVKDNSLIEMEFLKSELREVNSEEINRHEPARTDYDQE